LTSGSTGLAKEIPSITFFATFAGRDFAAARYAKAAPKRGLEWRKTVFF
jgi:hypothetical protein